MVMCLISFGPYIKLTAVSTERKLFIYNADNQCYEQAAKEILMA